MVGIYTWINAWLYARSQLAYVWRGVRTVPDAYPPFPIARLDAYAVCNGAKLSQHTNLLSNIFWPNYIVLHSRLHVLLLPKLFSPAMANSKYDFLKRGYR